MTSFEKFMLAGTIATVVWAVAGIWCWKTCFTLPEKSDREARRRAAWRRLAYWVALAVVWLGLGLWMQPRLAAV